MRLLRMSQVGHTGTLPRRRAIRAASRVSRLPLWSPSSGVSLRCSGGHIASEAWTARGLRRLGAMFGRGLYACATTLLPHTRSVPTMTLVSDPCDGDAAVDEANKQVL